MNGSAKWQLVALDLDGTLLRSDGSLSARTASALRAAERAGLTLVIVTARPPRRVRTIAAHLGLRGLALCSNGAVLYDLDRERIVQQTSLPVELAHALVEQLRRTLPEVAFAIEAGARYGCEPHYAIPLEHAHDAVDPALLRDDALRLCALGATKLIVQHALTPLPLLLEHVREHAGALSVTHSGSQFVEVAACDLTKAAALAVLCAQRGGGREPRSLRSGSRDRRYDGHRRGPGDRVRRHAERSADAAVGGTRRRRRERPPGRARRRARDHRVERRGWSGARAGALVSALSCWVCRRGAGSAAAAAHA